MKKLFLPLIIGLFCCLSIFSVRTSAGQEFPVVGSTDQSSCLSILDGNPETSEPFYQGTTLTVACEEPIAGLYIEWEWLPGEWTLRDGASEVLCGQNGFLHEYVPLSGTSNTISFTVTSDCVTITNLYVFSEGELPDFVQVWEPAWNEPVDVLFYAAAQGDEKRFFQNLIPSDAKIQAVYFTDHSSSESYRNHLLLNSLWKMGFDHYPQLGSYFDYYAEDYEWLSRLYEQDNPDSGVRAAIRRFAPQVVVTPQYGEQDDLNSHYASALILNAAKTEASDQWKVQKVLAVPENSGLSAEDVMQDVYTYDERAEKTARAAARELEASANPQKAAETDKRAGHSLKLLILIIAAITAVLVIADILIIRTRRKR